MEVILSVVAGYLIGSISCAIIVSRILGRTDPRKSGSGNPGATNVLRISGKLAAILTLAGDIAKGTVPVLAVKLLTDDPVAVGITALAAFFGHVFPLYYKFKGGKGIATMLGAYLGIDPIFALLIAGVWIVVAAITRYSSISSIVSSFASPFVAWYLFQNWWFAGMAAIIFVFVLYRHKDNLGRLRDGKESKIKLSA